MLIVITPELRTEHSKNAAIVVSNALKSKGRIRILTLRAIKIPSRAISPLHVNHIDRTGNSWETFFLVPPHYWFQLLRRVRHEHIFVGYAPDMVNNR